MRFTKDTEKTPNEPWKEDLHPGGVKVKKENMLNVHGQKEPRFARHRVWVT